MLKEFKQGDILICPACGKEFKANLDTLYFINSDPACSWKCFLKYYKSHHIKRDKEIFEADKKRKDDIQSYIEKRSKLKKASLFETDDVEIIVKEKKKRKN